MRNPKETRRLALLRNDTPATVRYEDYLRGVDIQECKVETWYGIAKLLRLRLKGRRTVLKTRKVLKNPAGDEVNSDTECELRRGLRKRSKRFDEPTEGKTDPHTYGTIDR